MTAFAFTVIFPLGIFPQQSTVWFLTGALVYLAFYATFYKYCFRIVSPDFTLSLKISLTFSMTTLPCQSTHLRRYGSTMISDPSEQYFGDQEIKSTQ